MHRLTKLGRMLGMLGSHARAGNCRILFLYFLWDGRQTTQTNSYPAGIDNIWQQTWWPHEKLLLLYRFCMILWRKSTGYCNAIASIWIKCATFCLDLRSKTMPEKRKHEEVRMETTSPSSEIWSTSIDINRIICCQTFLLILVSIMVQC